MSHFDGNKRIAWASSMVFQRVNGYRVRVSADDAERLLIGNPSAADVFLHA